MNGLNRITELADRLSPSDQLKLVEHLAHRLQREPLPAKQPLDLYGKWGGRFPDDADIDKILREIRDEWKKEMDLDL